MNDQEQQYINLLKEIMENGTTRMDRTGVGTMSLFGKFLRFDLNKGFPLLTTKKIHFKSVAHELLWFLKGDSNIKYLKDNGVSIWDEWADESGNLGPVYGVQWRNWKTHKDEVIDQINEVVQSIKNNPNSRRHLVSAWNVSDVDQMKLPPCHYAFQFYVSDGKLSCMWQQRSVDTFLGLPFNIASYALLTHMIANICGLGVGELIASLGDTHIYANHVEQVEQQMNRDSRDFPILKIKENTYTDPAEFTYEDFEIVGYNPHPAIRAPIAI